MDQKRMENEVLMKPESVSWQVQRGTRVALLCGATAALTDQQLIKSLDNDIVLFCAVARKAQSNCELVTHDS